MCNAAWADEVVVPTPVYSNDFSSTDGLTVVGNGVFEDDADPRFGKIFHNDPTNTSAVRSNYLKLPADVLSHSATSKEMTIGFWVNKKEEDSFFFTPLFAAYGDAPSTANSWPMLVCETRGLIQLNCSGYCDFGINDETPGTSYNDGTPYVNTVWLDDAEWHYYTVVFTTTTAKVYIDGVLKNGWTVNGTSDGQVISGLLEHGNDLDYVTLGGNQAWNWADPDPAFGFDDFAVYDEALSVDQIKQIMKNKLVQGTQIGEIDYSTAYYSIFSDWVTLYPGQSFTYRFVNYTDRSENYKNWNLFVRDPSNTDKFILRADWWENLNGSAADDHRRGITSDAADYGANVPSKMNGATVEMTVTFTSDKKFTMASTTTSQDGSTTWTYNYTSDNANNVDLTSYASLKFALSVDHSWLDILSTKSIVDISTIEWATFVSNNALDFTGSGVKAYVVTGASGSAITKTAVTTVAANTPLLLNAPEGTYTIPVATTGTNYSTTNKLVAGTGEAVAYDANSGYNYVLSIDKGKAMFMQIVDGTPATIPVGKAYLALDAAPARGLNLFDDEETTGVNEVKTQKVAGEYFNLAGQRVANPTKGLYIVNGKKVVIK